MRGRAVVARRAHNPEVVGSNPAPATKNSLVTANKAVFILCIRIHFFESKHFNFFYKTLFY